MTGGKGLNTAAAAGGGGGTLEEEGGEPTWMMWADLKVYYYRLPIL